MAEYVHIWLFFFLLVGSVIFFAVRFSRLARSAGKNHYIFGFLGAGVFLLTLRALGYVAEWANAPKGYSTGYISVVVAVAICFGLYQLLAKKLSKGNR